VIRTPALRLALTAAIAATLVAACQRKEEPAATEASAAPATTAAPVAAASAPAPVPATPADEAPPEGVLRAYVWQCDDGNTLKMRNLYRENAIAIDLHEGTRKLPLVPSASGAKYDDGTVSFFSKGAEAVFTRKGGQPVKCRELRSQSLLEDARLRGVLYSGSGNEPGWTLEVGPGSDLMWVTAYGQERHEFANALTSGDAATGFVYTATNPTDQIKVTVLQTACKDDMSGAAFDYQVTVASGGREYRGCGNRLQH